MSLKITSVTYPRHRSRTILGTGRFSCVKTAKSAGGLRETLCPEMAFASAGGRLLAGCTSYAHARFRRHLPVAGGGHFERTDPAPRPNAERPNAERPNAGRSPNVFMPRRARMHSAMHPRPAKGRG